METDTLERSEGSKQERFRAQDKKHRQAELGRQNQHCFCISYLLLAAVNELKSEDKGS